MDLPKSDPSPDSHLHLRKDKKKMKKIRNLNKGDLKEMEETWNLKGNYITKIRPEFQEMGIICAQKYFLGNKQKDG